ncbi:2-dehydro-3-deoxygalactonokinase [Marivita sp. GX14005]|uniref:2-dehydro-3-deoxygalactonokinase n=1 Tax=Marivita sp. GX14005 TaxID=2942276 RepID=UPI00201966B3|nr:2-dehydro-3-deoxygalactonokinase [Marivita sp. GX14005]MCL3883394.1 2-dehydro-3-deoxygalactonokinase [Marivita sp. GX14005]
MADWIAVEWRGAHLRIWGMSRAGEVRSSREVGASGAEKPTDIVDALTAVLGETPSVPILASGLPALIEDPERGYVPVPCAPPGLANAVKCQGVGLDLWLLPGLRQAQPTDLTKGAETRIKGYLALNPKFDGVICLPEAQTVWAHISAGEIVSFRSFLTSTLRDCLAQSRLLGGAVSADAWDEAAFVEAVAGAMTRPAEMAARLSSLRAAHVLGSADSGQEAARLAGVLIGVELAAARPYWLGQQVALVGEDKLCRAYAAALGAQAVPVERTDADRMTLEGLKAAFAEA